MSKYAIVPCLLMALSCAHDEGNAGGTGDLLREQSFVAISRPDGQSSFYIALRKKELNQRYFLSASVSRSYPWTTTPAPIEPYWLGTRVVSFRVQNGKLFVFDAQEGRSTSDNFEPSLIVEAYPLVEDGAFDAMAGHEDYVLFDPAAGLNRFGVVSDIFGQDVSKTGTPLHFQVDLSYLQHFRRIDDGATFEQVFTGAISDTLAADEAFGENRYRWSGTLGIALRRYAEGPGFQPVKASRFSQDYFFRSSRNAQPPVVKNTGEVLDYAIKWNIHPGMKPIRWLIDPRFVAFSEAHPKYDILGAIRGGIEGWNDVFGFEALKAEVATDRDSYLNDDANYFLYDADLSTGGVWAEPRYNPNNGEIRGAYVYFNEFALHDAINEFDPPEATALPRRNDPSPRFTWGDLQPMPPCELGMSSLDGEARGPSEVTPEQKVSMYIRHIALHEIGHTLGLRHNFKGGLLPLPQVSSVMEYLTVYQDVIDSGGDRPGPYDREAIRLLYGLSDREPSQPFCTDPQMQTDPTCSNLDRTEDPLAKHWGPSYTRLLLRILRGELSNERGLSIINANLNGTAAFLRAGTPADKARAWSILREPLAVGVDHTADNAAYPGYTDRLSTFQNDLLRRLYFDSPAARGRIRPDPVLAGDTLVSFVTELRDTVTNRDTYRGWNTRRTTVDVLEKLQVLPALEALRAARATVAQSGASLPPGSAEAALHDDLVARIDRAISPYFDQ